MRKREERTLVAVRRLVAERKIALAVAIFEFFWARFRIAMAALRDEMVSSRPVGRVSMAGTGGSYERAGGKGSVCGVSVPKRDVH